MGRRITSYQDTEDLGRNFLSISSAMTIMYPGGGEDKKFYLVPNYLAKPAPPTPVA